MEKSLFGFCKVWRPLRWKKSKNHLILNGFAIQRAPNAHFKHFLCKNTRKTICFWHGCAQTNVFKWFLTVSRPGIKDQRPETRDQGPETRDQRPETRDQRPETGDQRPETRDQRPGTRDTETRDQRPGTRDQRPENRDQRPETIDQRRGTTKVRKQWSEPNPSKPWMESVDRIQESKQWIEAMNPEMMRMGDASQTDGERQTQLAQARLRQNNSDQFMNWWSKNEFGQREKRTTGGHRLRQLTF